jgi:hypothetical protein
MSGGGDAPEPHPLPLTRQWVEDYQRHGTGPEEQPKPTGDVTRSAFAAGFSSSAPAGAMPPLSVKSTSRIPFRRMREAPHQGGYAHITAEEWAEYDRAMAEWQARRREVKR